KRQSLQGATSLKPDEREYPHLATPITRRQMLEAAGGITFLALSPIGRGLFAATLTREQAGTRALPLFTALPYIQPGPGEGRLAPGNESLVIAWQTNGVSAD